MALIVEPRSVVLYVAKCVSGGALVFLLARLLGYSDYDLTWVLISLVLVLSPDNTESIPLALTRIKANVAASAASLACLAIGPPSPVTICIAFALAIGVCYLAQAMTATRTALAAVVIIMLHKAGEPVWATAFERTLSVIAGCVLGLGVTFVFHRGLASRHKTGAESGE